MKIGIAEFWGLFPREFAVLSQEHNKVEREEMDLIISREEASDLRTGLLAAVIANAHRSKGKRFKGTDFIQIRKRPKPKMTTEEMLEVVKNMTIQMGGEVRI